MCVKCPEARRCCQSHWNWSCRWLFVFMWMLWIEPRSSKRVVSAVIHRVISPACIPPSVLFPIICLLLFYVHWYFTDMYVCVRLSDPLEVELRAAMWVLENEPGPLDEQPGFSTTEPSLQHPPPSIPNTHPP